MRQTELKIGDWVSFDGTPVKIKETTPTRALIDTSLCKDFASDEACATLRNLSPIPLTEDILRKNGWKEKVWSGENVYTSGWYALLRVGQEGLWAFRHYDDLLTTIQSVHELQHLLWALGMDDDLKI